MKTLTQYQIPRQSLINSTTHNQGNALDYLPLLRKLQCWLEAQAFSPAMTLRYSGFVLFFLVSTAALAQGGVSDCVPDSAVEKALNTWTDLRQSAYTTRDWYVRGDAQSEQVAKQFPRDVFIQRERDSWRHRDVPSRPALLAERESNYRTSPNEPVATYLYGRLLLLDRSSLSAHILEKLVSEHPRFPLARLSLAQAYRDRHGKSGSTAEVEQIRAYLELCPGKVEGFAALQRLPNDSFKAAKIEELKGIIEGSLETRPIEHIRVYAQLAMRMMPASGQQEIKTRVLTWLATVRGKSDAWSLAQLVALLAVYEEVESSSDQKWAEDRILREYPRTQAAIQIHQSRWREASQGTPIGADPAQRAKRLAASIAHYDQLLAIAPFSPELVNAKFRALREIPTTTDESITAIGRQLTEVMQQPPRSNLFNPLPLLILADEYVTRNIGHEFVHDLVEESLRGIAHFRKQADVMFPRNERDRGNFLAEMDAQEVLGVGLLAETLTVRGEISAAKRKLEQMNAILASQPTGDPSDVKFAIHLSALSRYKRAVALVDAATNRTGSALDTLRVAETWARQSNPGAYRTTRDVIGDRIRKLESTSEFAKKPEIPEASASSNTPRSHWSPSTSQLNFVSLPDVGGRLWEASDLGGKTVVINFWATWCGPCQVELQQLQQLKEKFTERVNVLFLTINLDDDASRVVPYLARNKISLPTLLAGKQVERVLGGGGGAIPQTLIVDPKGVIRLRNLGFANPKDWMQSAEQAIDSVAQPHRTSQATSSKEEPGRR